MPGGQYKTEICQANPKGLGANSDLRRNAGWKLHFPPRCTTQNDCRADFSEFLKIVPAAAAAAAAAAAGRTAASVADILKKSNHY